MIRDERVVDLGERALQRRRVGDGGFCAARVGRAEIRAQPATGEERLHQPGDELPGKRGSGEERRQRRAGEPPRPGEVDLRQEL